MYNFTLNEKMLAPAVPRKFTPEEKAERRAWLNRFVEEALILNEIEPLPDNFEDLCRGRAVEPIYANANIRA